MSCVATRSSKRFAPSREVHLAMCSDDLRRPRAIQEMTRHRVAIRADVAKRQQIARPHLGQPAGPREEVARVRRVAAHVGRDRQRRSRVRDRLDSRAADDTRSRRRCSRRCCRRRRSGGRRASFTDTTVISEAPGLSHQYATRLEVQSNAASSRRPTAAPFAADNRRRRVPRSEAVLALPRNSRRIHRQHPRTRDPAASRRPRADDRSIPGSDRRGAYSFPRTCADR